ncbi:hypothetical protein [Streptomyces sp. NPDC000410]|uniref:hypothetical protein n=1 Tax=Streptomyces sp. NPDC000410 TaxID=3154254 RepID=UPI0033173DCC
MKSLRTLVAGAALAAAMGATNSLPAHAADAPAPRADVGVRAEGLMKAWYNVNYINLCGYWAGSSYNWGDCWNTASSLWNDRYPGVNDDVWVHWGLNCQKARRGVYNGVYLANLSQWRFDQGTGQGSGELLDNNIASHCVTQLP